MMNKILEHGELKISEKILLLVLMDKENQKITIRDLAQISKLTERTINSILASLVEKEVITIKKIGKVNSYQINRTF